MYLNCDDIMTYNIHLGYGVSRDYPLISIIIYLTLYTESCAHKYTSYPAILVPEAISSKRAINYAIQISILT